MPCAKTRVGPQDLLSCRSLPACRAARRGQRQPLGLPVTQTGAEHPKRPWAHFGLRPFGPTTLPFGLIPVLVRAASAMVRLPCCWFSLITNAVAISGGRGSGALLARSCHGAHCVLVLLRAVECVRSTCCWRGTMVLSRVHPEVQPKRQVTEKKRELSCTHTG